MLAPVLVQPTLQHALSVITACTFAAETHMVMSICRLCSKHATAARSHAALVFASMRREQTDAGVQKYVQAIPLMLHLVKPVLPGLQECTEEHTAAADNSLLLRLSMLKFPHLRSQLTVGIRG